MRNGCKLSSTSLKSKFGRSFTDPKDNLQVWFDLSPDRLPETDRTLYHALGIFPENTPILDAVIARLWKHIGSQLSDFDCGELLTELARLELIERHPDKTVTMHDLLHDYMRGNLGDGLKNTHRELLRAYNSVAKSWWEMPDDGYIFENLVYHLFEAGFGEEAFELLTGAKHWQVEKSKIKGFSAFVDDIQLAIEKAKLLPVADYYPVCRRPQALSGNVPPKREQNERYKD